jgi:hypothetical protein
VLCHLTGYSQRVIRNFGFEDLDANQQLISWNWNFTNSKEQYVVTVDTSLAHTGKCAFSIALKPGATEDRGMVGFWSTLKFPDLHTAKKVRISAYIKTENLANGTASIGLQLIGVKGTIDRKESDEQSVKGSSGWTKHTIEVPLTFDVLLIYFGGRMTGTGKVWIDDFEIFIDDIPVGDNYLSFKK